MVAILSYLRKVITSGKDGTICVITETGEIGTLTIKSRRIISASLNDTKGKQAFDAIKNSNCTSSVFWTDVTQKEDIKRMIDSVTITNRPADPASQRRAPALETKSAAQKDDGGFSDGLFRLPEKNMTALKQVLTKYIGPAADFIVDDALQQSSSSKQLIHLLSEQLIDQNDIKLFVQQAYNSLSQTG